MCALGGGGGGGMPKPLTQEEIKKNTDNPFSNPVSGTEVPSWKLKADKKSTDTKPKLTTSDTYQG